MKWKVQYNVKWKESDPTDNHYAVVLEHPNLKTEADCKLYIQKMINKDPFSDYPMIIFGEVKQVQ